MAENDSLVQFTMAMERIIDRTEGADQDSEFMSIDRNLLNELRLEAQKLKDYRNMNKANLDQIAKLLSMLEQAVRQVVNEDGTLNLPLIEV